MSQALIALAGSWGRALATGALGLVRWLGRGLGALLGTALNLVLALVLLFEDWGWRPLAAALAWLARFRLWARIEVAIAGLPPYGALAVFVLPSALLFPLKLLGLWLLAHGQALAAGVLLVGAKIVGTALLARIFTLTRPRLMTIGWFARLHDLFIPWKEALFARVRASWPWRYGRMLKTRLRLKAQRWWGRHGAAVRALWARVRDRVRERAMAAWATLRRLLGRGL